MCGLLPESVTPAVAYNYSSLVLKLLQFGNEFNTNPRIPILRTFAGHKCFSHQRDQSLELVE